MLTTKEISEQYDKNYGAIRKWIASNPGTTFWLAIAAIVGTHFIRWLF